MHPPASSAVRKFGAAFVSAALCWSPGHALAWNAEETNLTVVQVGVHSGPVGFLATSSTPPANCQWGVYYFDMNTALGKGILATLLIAKSTGQKVRIAYTVPTAPNSCMLELAALM